MQLNAGHITKVITKLRRQRVLSKSCPYYARDKIPIHGLIACDLIQHIQVFSLETKFNSKVIKLSDAYIPFGLQKAKTLSKVNYGVKTHNRFDCLSQDNISGVNPLTGEINSANVSTNSGNVSNNTSNVSNSGHEPISSQVTKFYSRLKSSKKKPSGKSCSPTDHIKTNVPKVQIRELSTLSIPETMNMFLRNTMIWTRN